MQPGWLQVLNVVTAVANVAVLIYNIVRKLRGM